MVAVVTLPELLDVVWCSAVVVAVVAVVVASCSGVVVVIYCNQCSSKRSCSCSRDVV